MVVLLVYHLANALAVDGHHSHHHLPVVRPRILGCAFAVREQYLHGQHFETLRIKETLKGRHSSYAYETCSGGINTCV